MKRHLKRFGWLYLTLIAVIAYPAFIYRMQVVVPDLDVPTLRRIDSLIQEGLIRSHPNAEVKRAEATADLKFPEPPDYIGFIMGSLSTRATNLAAMPAVQPEMERVTDLCAPLFEKVDDIAARNVIYFPIGTTTETAAQVAPGTAATPDFLTYQTLSKIRVAQAKEAIQEYRWNDALRMLESSANIFAPYRYNYLICALIAIATRSTAYGGYNDLLNADPPPEVAQAALKSLVALRQTDPTADGWVWLGERLNMIQMNLQKESLSGQERSKFKAAHGFPDLEVLRSFWVLEKVKDFVNLREQIKDPALRKWADRFAQKYPRALEGGFILKENLKWTTIPTTRKWLGELVRKEPWVYRSPIIPENEYSKLDHWTLMLSGLSPSTNPYTLESDKRSRVAETQGRLVEAGFAAHLYKDKHGAWPKELTELAQYYPLPVEKQATGISTNKSSGSFLPIRIAEHKMTPELIGALWKKTLSINNWHFIPETDKAIQPDGSFAFASASQTGVEWYDEFVRIMAIEQLLKSHPSLVESAQVEVTTVSIPTQYVQSGVGFGPRVGMGLQGRMPEMSEKTEKLGIPSDMMPGSMMRSMPGMMPGSMMQGMPGMPGMMPEMLGMPRAAGAAKSKAPSPQFQFRPLTPELARQITNDTYRLKAIEAAKQPKAQNNPAANAAISQEAGGMPALPAVAPPIADATTITQPSLIRIHQFRLTGKLRAREKAMVIWSPGPDGKDDNAQIVYDSTNGTVSSGDIVLFPEKY